MFGFKSEETIKNEYRQKALQYFDIQVKNMYGSGALGWLRGGLELAQEIGLLSAQDVERIDSKGKAAFDANQKAQREEKERLIAIRKAERIEKAKAAKE